MVLPTEFISNHHANTGLYIDVENLGDDAQVLIETLLNSWPAESAPRPSLVNLYVKADATVLWETWALQHISRQTLNVYGIQHFTGQQSKNSADMAISVDAITDFLHGRISHVAVYSDDSDFISLFAKIRSEASDWQVDPGHAPFLWILTDRPGTKTPNIWQFFSSEYLHIVRIPPQPQTSEMSEAPVVLTGSLTTNDNPMSEEESIAIALIEELPLGQFKSPACKTIIADKFYSHHSARMDGARFGTYFQQEIWPKMENRGAKRLRESPPSYEMTQAAKNSLP